MKVPLKLKGAVYNSYVRPTVRDEGSSKVEGGLFIRAM